MRTFVIIGKFGTGKDLLIDIVSAIRKNTAIIIERNFYKEEELLKEIEHAKKGKFDLYIKATRKEYIPKNILEKSTIMYTDKFYKEVRKILKEREEKDNEKEN